MSRETEVMMGAFYDEMSKLSSAGKYFAAAAGGGAVVAGAGKAKKMYGLAKKEQQEQNDAAMLKRMQALQDKMALRKRYGAAFSQT